MMLELEGDLIEKAHKVSLFSKVALIGKNSKRIYQEKEHVLLGISPFNSYFVEDKMVKLIDWALAHFKRVNIIIPDGISVFTLMAIGYSAEKAESKTRKQDRYLKNKVFRAIYQLGFSDLDGQQMLISLSDLLENPQYQQIYKKCLELFETDPAFREGCLTTSSWVLGNYSQSAQLSAARVELAATYFLKELPFFLDTAAILNVKSSLFVYHTIPQYLQDLYNTSPLVSSRQGYLSIHIT